jgi:hypothetical protein
MIYLPRYIFMTGTREAVDMSSLGTNREGLILLTRYSGLPIYIEQC